MPTLRSGDAQLFYEITGSGPDVVLLHPFPLNHHFWDGITDQLSSRYRIVLPDLRAHGDSDAGDGPVTMQKLADDLDRLCRELEITRAIFVGVSIGGYAMFEFWRRYRERVAALVLANTRAGAETPEGRAARLQAADKVVREGTAGFADDLLQKLFSKTTLSQSSGHRGRRRGPWRNKCRRPTSPKCNAAWPSVPIRCLRWLPSTCPHWSLPGKTTASRSANSN